MHHRTLSHTFTLVKYYILHINDIKSTFIWIFKVVSKSTIVLVVDHNRVEEVIEKYCVIVLK